MIGFVLADLRRLWVGGLFVVVLIALATALGAAVILQERALRLGSARAADAFDLVIGASGSETQLVLSTVFLQPAPLPLLPGAVLSRLAADPRVAFAAPVGFGDFYGDHPIIGTTNALATFGGRFPLAEGRGFERLDDAVAGARSGLALGDTVHPMHGHAEEGGHGHEAVAYRVVGRMAPTGTPWDRAILVPIEAVWAVHRPGAGNWPTTPGAASHGRIDLSGPVGMADAENPGVPAILVKPKTIAEAYRLRGEYRTGPTLAVFPGEVLTRLYATLGDARTVLAIVAYGAQALVGAAIALVAVLHVAQRRRQIGALRAMGAPRLAVFGIVWCELLALVGAGILAGLALGYGAARLISGGLERSGGFSLPVAYQSADAGFVAALLAGAALIAAVPALLAYRLPPAEALRV
ncbi:ABC transporter permease [Ancylobacter terrae]|uniref:ABC transporter permease n=1 Tax=Ancylobacter sp. sgz301288 TaxID=3342077 RepID=UPI00385B615C